jgi:uncharacterized protein (TIGR00369 family)
MSDSLRVKSGFADLVGYDLLVWREDHAEVAIDIEARHLNRSGFMHGGVLTTVIDAACGYTGCYSPEGAPPRRAFTLSLNSHFIAATRPGARLTAIARKSGGGKGIFFAACEVRDDSGRLIGQGDAVFKYITPRADPKDP